MVRPQPEPSLFDRLLQWLGLAPTRSLPQRKKVRSRARRAGTKKAPWSGQTPPWRPPQVATSLDPVDLRLQVRDDLLARVERLEALSADRVKGDIAFLTRLSRTMSSKSLDLPVFPSVSIELDRLLRGGDPNSREVVKLLSREPDLLRRVWQRANCALYRVPVTDIDKAIARIGYDEIWRIGMSVCLQGTVFRAGPYQPQVEELRSMGMIAGNMAAWLERTPRGESYLAGLLHPAGAMYILRHAAQSRSLRPSDACIAQVIHQHSAALSVLMVRAWNLGDKVAAGVGGFGQPREAPEDVRPFVENLRTGVLAAHIGKGAVRGGGSAEDRILLQSYLDEAFEVDRVVKRAERAWKAETDGEQIDEKVVEQDTVALSA